MAAYIARRLCQVQISGCLERRCTSVQAWCSLHSSCVLTKNESLDSSQTSSTSVNDEQKDPEMLLKSHLLMPKTVTKAQKISWAMQSYMERAQKYDKMMKKEIDEYDIGRRHLANIMGKDPDLFEQEDIDEAIEYLLPTGIYNKGARPVLKHPYEIFPKRKAAQFGEDGRPFHTMFYTGKPNFYSLLHDISIKIEDLKKEEDKLQRKGRLHEVEDKKLQLFGSDWITLQHLKDLTLENIGEHHHKHFVALMEKLAQQPLAFTQEEFIMKYRRSLMARSFGTKIKEVKTDELGRTFMIARGKRKTSKAFVKLWNKGTGKFTINGQSIQYFSFIMYREQVLAPLVFLGKLGEVDVEARVSGGGGTGQSGAIRLAVAKAMVPFVDADTREKMRIAGLLTPDIRRRERKKPGQEGARRKFTWKKR